MLKVSHRKTARLLVCSMVMVGPVGVRPVTTVASPTTGVSGPEGKACARAQAGNKVSSKPAENMACEMGRSAMRV